MATWTPPSRQAVPGCRRKCAPLGSTVSNPPTQAEMPVVADKLDEVITGL